MNFIKKTSKLIKTTLIGGVFFIIYGYLCRMVGFYFFWESKPIGWLLLFIGIIGLLFDRIKFNHLGKQNSILEKIGIGVIVFILFVQTILLVSISLSDAYLEAKRTIIQNPQLVKELGKINGFGIIPTGRIQKATDSTGEYGFASLNLIIKGNKKYKETTVIVVKYANSPVWQIDKID